VPRFYFQLSDGLSTVADRTGQEFPDAASAREFAAAHREAFSRRCANFNGESWLPWSANVIDEHGQQVFTMTLMPH
jgi:hypothetical protein